MSPTRTTASRVAKRGAARKEDAVCEAIAEKQRFGALIASRPAGFFGLESELPPDHCQQFVAFVAEIRSSMILKVDEKQEEAM